ncbi:hypothetical protein GCM10027076_19890 [Nocardioides montaniterrae]
MLRLVRVELNRLWWRRAIRVLVPIGVLLPLVMLCLWTANTKPHDSRAWDKAVARAAAQARSPEFQQQIDDCVQHQWQGPDTTRETCLRDQAPRPEWFIQYDEMHPRDATNGFGGAAAIMIAAVLGLAAMTYAGADWSSGSISNQLLFNPRRVELFFAKLLAIGGLAAAVTAIVQAVWWGAFAVVATARDLPWTGSLTADALAVVAKSVAFSVVAAVAAYSLTMLLRHTVAALGAAIAILAVSSAFILGVYTGGLQAWSPPLATAGIFFDDVTYTTHDWNAAGEERFYSEHHVRPAHGFGLWGGAAVLLTLAGAVAFRRRDVP